jgi:hypothetical protein
LRIGDHFLAFYESTVLALSSVLVLLNLFRGHLTLEGVLAALTLVDLSEMLDYTGEVVNRTSATSLLVDHLMADHFALKVANRSTELGALLVGSIVDLGACGLRFLGCSGSSLGRLGQFQFLSIVGLYLDCYYLLLKPFRQREKSAPNRTRTCILGFEDRYSIH